MHYLMLVTLTLAAGSTSAEARHTAYSRLMDDDSFCGEGGRFGSPLCDWFVIGGRWSGYLQEAIFADKYRDALRTTFPEMAGMVSTAWVDCNRDSLNRLWRQCGGNGDSPLVRDSYEHLGYEDDAMLVTDTLYRRLLSELDGTCDDETSRFRFADLDNDPVATSFIGCKWLVVADYHC